MTSLAETFDTIRPRYPELSGKVALVTGSSRGIGKGIALRLAREGMQIIIHGQAADEVDGTVAEFQSLGVDVVGVTTDFSQPDGADKLFDAVAAEHDALEILVNNAADLRRTEIDRATVELLDYQMQVNIRAPYVCSLRAVPLMKATGSGSIINISSVGGQRAHWDGLPYDMTKGSNDATTRAMAINLAQYGIRVNAIAPGAIRGQRTPPDTTDFVQGMIQRIPLGRLGNALDIGAAVAFLASEDATYISGHILNVDGGIMAQISPKGQFI